jgi:hypothetical protein
MRVLFPSILTDEAYHFAHDIVFIIEVCFSTFKMLIKIDY